MVKYVIAEQLVGKEVVTSDGFDVGKFVDADLDEVTGKLSNIYVEPNLDSDFANKLDVKSGVVKLPSVALVAVNDYIVVDRKSIV
ncbi:MAG: PRC-barrel domain-containing protein [Candidatus Micrarchaeia archaeon]